ncbi:MAG: cellulase family glycosylhydrolase [Acetobacteraceae bacterium]
MTTRFRRLATLAVVLAVLLARASAWATPPPPRLAALARGVNITNWFRFPASMDPAAIGAYLSDAAMADLRRVGFTFVRLPFDPIFAASLSGRDLLVAQARRLQAAGLAVILVPASATWRLEDRPADRAALLDTWRRLAPALRALPSDGTFPEAVNEPVFPAAAAAWADLQLRILATIRDALPANTVVLDGANWSSLDGLEALAPAADPDVVYSFHFYDPAELTSLAAYRPGLDTAALARLPFPMDDPVACARAARSPDAPTMALVRYVCAPRWNREAIEARIARAANWAARHHAAVLAGEFGASAQLNPEARLAWIAAVREACEQDGIGWALWGYDDVMGFDVARPPAPRPRLDTGLLRALGMAQLPREGISAGACRNPRCTP